jgi:hypothetical protein
MLRTFFVALAPILPVDVTITVASAGDTIDDATGNLVGSWSATVGAPVVGTLNSVYSAPAGATVGWNTAGIVGTRRLRGRTFIVPLGTTNATQQGDWNATVTGTLQTAANALIATASPSMVIWSRPVHANPSHVPPIAARAGSSSPVVSATVKSKMNVLTSRRD